MVDMASVRSRLRTVWLVLIDARTEIAGRSRVDLTTRAVGVVEVKVGRFVVDSGIRECKST